MKLPLFIARRYLVSKRKKNFINFISILAIIGVAFSTAALIVVLSVFNGLESLLRSLNNAFDPEIKVAPLTGKSFSVNGAMLHDLRAIDGVANVTEVIEDYAYVRYREANQLVTIKGVSDDFLNQHNLDQYITTGKLALHRGDVPLAIVGRGIQYYLSLAVDTDLYPLQVYYIKNVNGTTLDPSRIYSRKSILPGAVFSVVANLDENYIIVPLDFAKSLFDYSDRRNALEITTTPGSGISNVQSRLGSYLGSDFEVLNQEEQHRDLYRLLRMEKLFTFLSFTLLLAIGSISIFFSLMMLALDKRKDISVLSAMGATPALIRRIFLAEGSYIAGIGTALGLLLGGLLTWLQMRYGIISMGMETAVTEGYPVKVVWADLLATVITVAVLTVLISLRPAWLAARSSSVQHL